MKNYKIIVALMIIICVMISAVACNIGKKCEHADENLDHSCDICAEPMGECADANKDHKCDYGCAKEFETHKESEGSHNCAYCGGKISDCVPNADDGDCTTAILCSVCNAELAQAKSAHEAGEDDGDCTTEVGCANCDQIAIEAGEHNPNADDGDCTTAVTCKNCTTVVIEAKNHVAGADDNDCTTAIKCANCDKNAVEAKQHATKLYSDGANGHHTECDNGGCNYKTETVAHARAEEGKCACGYTCETLCDLCGRCENLDCDFCENVCYFVDESKIIAPIVLGTTMENLANYTQKWTMTREDLNGISGVRYTSNSKIDFKIIGSAYAPCLQSEKLYFRLVFKNNGTTDVTLQYITTQNGNVGSVTVTVPAGQTVEAFLEQSAKSFGTGCHHQVKFTSGNDTGYDITIAGEVSLPKKEIKIEGAKINGSNVIETAYGLTLDASAQITYDSENAVDGWEYNGTVYQSYEKLAAVRLNPYTCDTIKVVYGEAPANHEDSFCSECGKCKNYTCDFDGCNEADRCQGHFDAESLKVMSFNICTSGYAYSANTSGVINRVISNMPDVLGTQEENSLWTSVLQDALASYGYKNVIMYRDGVVNSSSGNEGTGIWYNSIRLELLDWGYFWVSDTPEQVSSWSQYGAVYRRVTNWAKFYDKASGKTFVYYNTHLGYESSQLFLRSAELMMDRMHEHYNEGLPVIVTGDFNFAINHDGGLEAYNRYMQALNDSHYEAIVKNYAEGKENTFGAYGTDSHSKPIDYILYTDDFIANTYTIFREEFPEGVSRTGDNAIDRQYFSSDHYAIQTVFNFADSWGEHYCWDACEVCGNCLDADCAECTVKCNHTEVCYKCGGEVILTSDAEGHWYGCENGDYAEEKADHIESSILSDGFIVCSVCGEKYRTFADESRVVVPFVPSTRMENKNYTNSSSTTMETVEINGLTGVRYVANDKRDFRIGNTANNYCPVLKNDKVYYHLIIKNNGETDVEFAYQPEYFGVRGEVKVKVAAGETVEVLLVQNELGNRDNSTHSIHDVIFKSGNDNGYDITIAGYTSVPKKDVQIVGATIGGKNTVGGSAYGINTTLDANAEVVFENENNYGWLYNGKWYETYAELAQVAINYYTCDTIKAVYAEDFTTLFVPNAKPERINGGSVLPTAEYVKDADGNIVATRFSAAAGDNATYFKLLNNSNHASGNANYINNVFASSKSCLLLTLKNNSDKAVTLTYEIEYWGVRGTTTVTLAAGEEKTVLVVVAAATGKSDSNSAFHQMKVENAADGYDVTIYGYRVI